MKSLTVSLIIPVYNEEDYLKSCLDAIARQSEAPDEVIVVDNNSTDKSVEIARSYPFVKVLKERHQGIVYVRNRGFNAATSDIIGRIDADTHLGEDWIKIVKAAAQTMDEADAMTGPCRFYDADYPKLLFGFHRAIYFWSSAFAFGHTILFGSNMFFFRSNWLRIRQETCRNNAIHEDMDLSNHVVYGGGKIHFNKSLPASASSRRFHNWRYYPTKWARTWMVHGLLPSLYQSVRRIDEKTEY
jgi:glycosyltransferase involved in cell wall biosynthesis